MVNLAETTHLHGLVFALQADLSEPLTAGELYIG